MCAVWVSGLCCGCRVWEVGVRSHVASKIILYVVLDSMQKFVLVDHLMDDKLTCAIISAFKVVGCLL